MYYLGIDLGGTTIKAGVVNRQYELICAGSRPTAIPRGAEEIIADIAEQARAAATEAGLRLQDIERVGIGSPGIVDGTAGIVRYAGNLRWRDVPLRDAVQRQLGLPVQIGNDANVAALGEYCAGSARGVNDAVIVTLGTGVGSGAIVNGKIITGHNAAATEFGHMVIEHGGRPCTCGKRGCWEAYSSATALIAMTREAMEAAPDSLLCAISRADGKVSGKTAFRAMRRGDAAGRAVVERYIDYLAVGVSNVINILQPQRVCLGGGVSKEGDLLLLPLRERVKPYLFGRGAVEPAELLLCTLGNDAGMIGAAALEAFM